MRYIPFIFLFLPFLNYAQTTFKLSMDSRSGYEYNAFNQAKIPRNIDSISISSNGIQSSAFQQLGLSSQWKKTIVAHQFSWNAKARMEHFWQLSAANLQRWETAFVYRYQWTKSKSFQTNVKYLSYQTNRVDNGTAVIAVPSAYTRWSSHTSFKWQPFKHNKSAISTQMTRKEYAATKAKQLRYWSFDGKFSSTQKIKRSGKRASYLNGTISFQQRNYTNSPVAFYGGPNDFNEEAGIEDFVETEKPQEHIYTTFRKWQYFTASMDYAFYLKKTLKWTAGLSYQRRVDVRDKKFDYQQLAPFMQIKWKSKKWQAAWKVSATVRQFEQLFADRQKVYPLQHLYLRNSLALTYELTKKWTVSTQLNFRKRWRNQPIASTTSYAPYLTGFTSIGIQYRWNKKKLK